MKMSVASVLTICFLMWLGTTLSTESRAASAVKPIPSPSEVEQPVGAKLKNVMEHEALKKSKNEVGLIFLATFCICMVAGIAAKPQSESNKSIENARRIVFAAAAASLSAYLISSVYFDIQIGRTSSSSTSGAHIVAYDGSVTFWIIVVLKIAAASIPIFVGIGLLRKNGKSH